MTAIILDWKSPTSPWPIASPRTSKAVHRSGRFMKSFSRDCRRWPARTGSRFGAAHHHWLGPSNLVVCLGVCILRCPGVFQDQDLSFGGVLDDLAWQVTEGGRTFGHDGEAAVGSRQIQSKSLALLLLCQSHLRVTVLPRGLGFQFLV